MIVMRIMGGLANQMFQWAYARSMSNKYNMNFILDTSFYNNNTHRSFGLHKFPNINLGLSQSNVICKNVINDDFTFKLIEPNNTYFNGYWQSEEYFIDSKDIIIEELKPSEDIIKKLSEKLYPGKISVSIHIRRTDYVSSNGYHPIMPIEYYEKALSVIQDYDYIYVFSDDIKWCKENFKFDNMIFIENQDDIEDIWLMSMCNHNIIANSTFSWWGAWLNQNPDKIVVAPNNWFGKDVNINTDEIIPNNWVKL